MSRTIPHEKGHTHRQTHTHTRACAHTRSCTSTWNQAQIFAPMCIHTNPAAHKCTQDMNTQRNTINCALCCGHLGTSAAGLEHSGEGQGPRHGAHTPLPGAEKEEAKQASRIFLGSRLGGTGSNPGAEPLLTNRATKSPKGVTQTDIIGLHWTPPACELSPLPTPTCFAPEMLGPLILSHKRCLHWGMCLA